MLIICLPEKMLRDLRNSKGAQSYLLHQWRFWLVAFNRNDPETCVGILHIKAPGRATRYSNVNASFVPQSTLLAEATITHTLLIPLLNQPSGGQYVHNSCFLSYGGL